MANSSDVVANNRILATEYNNLRKDVLDNTLGHDHEATDGKRLAKNALRWTAAKLLLGAGAGEPTEINIPSGDYPMKQLPDITRWVLPGWTVEGLAFFALSSGRIYYIPIFVEETTTYIRIGLKVTTSQVGNIDLRIFEWDNGLPGALILSAGTVDAGSTGNKEITISQELQRGYYFLALRASVGSIAIQIIDGTKPFNSPVSAIHAVQNLDVKYLIMFASAVYNDPAPTPTSIDGLNGAGLVLREN